jgi:hypothetical protein
MRLARHAYGADHDAPVLIRGQVERYSVSVRDYPATEHSWTVFTFPINVAKAVYVIPEFADLPHT